MIVSVADMKVHLRIQHDEEDEYIEGLIKQAQEAAENYCRVRYVDEAPETVKLAIKLMVAHYYENRDNPDRFVYRTMISSFQNLLYPNRDVALMI